MNDFEKQAHLIHEKRIEEYRKEVEAKQRRGEPIYTEYCLWCNAFRDGFGKTNAKQFGEWLKAEKITLTNEQRRWIGENKFGLKFSVKEDGTLVRKK